jgi:hypothetical protein
MDNDTPSRLEVELEVMYRVRVWLAILGLRVLRKLCEGERKLVAGCEERRDYGVAYIGAQASTAMEINQALPWL